MPRVQIDCSDRSLRPHPFQLEAFVPFLTALGAAVLGERSFELSLTLIGDRGMRALNREHRGKDKTTDVLSFPQETDLRARIADPTWQPTDLVLGDLVISPPQCLKQADEWDWTPQERMAQLLIHGFLHLCGWDHEIETERLAMEALEEELFQLLAALPLAR